MTLLQIQKEIAAAIFHIRKLMKILNKLSERKVLEEGDYDTESPFRSLYDLEERLKATTATNIAEIFFKDLNNKYWQNHD